MHQLVELKRLGDEIRRAALDRVHGVLHRAVAGDDDADDAGIAADRRFDHPPAVDAGHAEIGDDDVEGELLEQIERFFAVFGFDHLDSRGRGGARP